MKKANEAVTTDWEGKPLQTIKKEMGTIGVMVNAESVEQVSGNRFRINIRVQTLPDSVLAILEEHFKYTFQDLETLLGIEALMTSVEK